MNGINRNFKIFRKPLQTYLNDLSVEKWIYFKDSEPLDYSKYRQQRT